ncbi:DUF4245 domain-containing protein [Actinoplanes sp. HUAS TT8]|uniref:DUF4245 domain-containing protein n=1 Tax=Actinoplanes sp. HUAS TT8 TaxID=3447453 RepID=UPI003F522DAC
MEPAATETPSTASPAAAPATPASGQPAPTTPATPATTPPPPAPTPAAPTAAPAAAEASDRPDPAAPGPSGGSDVLDALAVPVATGVPVEAAEPAPRLTKREGRSPRDMALSLVVLMVPIVLLLVFYRVVLGGDEPMTVDPASSIQLASREFTVLAPTGLNSDWRVTAANFKREKDGATLRIGYVDPDDKPVQVVESTVPADTLVPAEVGREGKRTGAYRTDTRTWLVYSGRPDETALIFTEANRTVLIIGKTDRSNLEKVAASLK